MQGLLAIKRYVQFLGRAGRREYWQFIGLSLAIYVAAAVLGDGAAYAEAGLLPPLMILAMLVLVLPGYCVTIRRLHDRGLSGLWLAAIWVLNGIYYALQNIRVHAVGTIADGPLAFLTYADLSLTLGFAIWLFLHLVREGDPAANAYGPPPAEGDASTRNTESMQRINQALHEVIAGDLVPSADLQPADSIDVRSGDMQQIDALGQIERMANLHREGLLSDAEFQQQKARLLR